MRILPALFNTDMTRAILEDRKTATRRLIKEPFYIEDEDAEVSRVSGLAMHKGTNITHGMPYPDSLYSPGDILYVREAFAPNYFSKEIADFYNNGNRTAYRADFDSSKIGDVVPEPKWHPSIHMPKEAARIFLQVTEVRIERLQQMTSYDAYIEGFRNGAYGDMQAFYSLWESTIKPADRGKYGWQADPWVWVIRFERCEKPEG